jgi:hypothetical protein
MRPSGPGVAVTKPCACGAALAMLAGNATPINDKSRIIGTKNKKILNFIGAEYIIWVTVTSLSTNHFRHAPKSDSRHSIHFPYLFLISGKE